MSFETSTDYDDLPRLDEIRSRKRKKVYQHSLSSPAIVAASNDYGSNIEALHGKLLYIHSCLLLLIDY